VKLNVDHEDEEDNGHLRRQLTLEVNQSSLRFYSGLIR